MGDRIPDTGVANLFDRGRDKTNFSGPKLRNMFHFRTENPNPVHVMHGPVGHHFHPIPFFKDTVNNAHKHNNAQITVVPTIDEHRL